MYHSEMAALQRRAAGKHLERIDVRHHCGHRRLFLVLDPCRQHPDADAADPVPNPGALLQLLQDAGGGIDQGIGEIDESQAASRAADAPGAG